MKSPVRETAYTRVAPESRRAGGGGSDKSVYGGNYVRAAKSEIGLIVVTFRCPRRGKHYLYDSADKSIAPRNI